LRCGQRKDFDIYTAEPMLGLYRTGGQRKSLTGRLLFKHAILVLRQSKKGTPYRINAIYMYFELCMCVSTFTQRRFYRICYVQAQKALAFPGPIVLLIL